MTKHRFQNATLFMCILMLALAPWARSQEQTCTVPQAGARPSKEQPKEAEPEANTNSSTEALQKATQNPVASLISAPVQNNTNFGVNPGYRTQDVLNIQPVIPIGISKDWNLLVRWIMPIVWQPVPNAPGTPETGEYGLGEMTPTFFISPKKARGADLGSRTNISVAHGHEHVSGAGETGYRAIRRCADATRPLDSWGPSSISALKTQ